MHPQVQNKVLHNSETNSLVLPPHSCRRSLHHATKATNCNLNPHPKNAPQKTTKPKTREGKLLAGLRPNNATWPVCWQLCSADTDGRAKLCSPLPYLRNSKENVHCNYAHSALYLMRTQECLRLPLLGAQSFKSEKTSCVDFSQNVT